MTAFVSSFFQAGIEVSLYHNQGSPGRRRPPRPGSHYNKYQFQYFIYIAYIVGIDVWHGPGEEKQKSKNPHGIERIEYTDGYEYQ